MSQKLSQVPAPFLRAHLAAYMSDAESDASDADSVASAGADIDEPLHAAGPPAADPASGSEDSVDAGHGPSDVEYDEVETVDFRVRQAPRRRTVDTWRVHT